MKVTISNEIKIQDPPAALVKEIRQELAMANPEYMKKLRMGLWTGNTPAQIYLYRVDGNTIIIPCGAGNILQKYIDRETVVLEDLADNKQISYPGSIPLYGYQQQAVHTMAASSCGILQSPCGSGKTQMGIALAALLKRKALWVTHTQDLLQQSYKRAAQYFPEELLGKITAGICHIGTHITFATVQTLSKLDLEKYKYTWDVIIVDECHRCSGSPTAVHMFYKVMSGLAARYKFGLSATVHRSDGLIKSTFAVIGPVRHIVPEEEVRENTMAVNILRRDTGVKPNRSCQDTDGTLVYSKLLPYLAENMERNRLIAMDLIKNRDHSNLILSDRLEHLKTLKDLLPEELKDTAVMIDGKMTSKKAKVEREIAIEDMRNGKKRYLFASFGLAKEGLDIPCLDRLYLTTPKKDYAVVTQCVGRIARKASGKGVPICYDYVDHIGFCVNQYKKRKTIYKKAGCTIIEEDVCL